MKEQDDNDVPIETAISRLVKALDSVRDVGIGPKDLATYWLPLAREARDEAAHGWVPTPGIKYISATEFREQGYLQEVNRRFLHPLGLALEVLGFEDGIEIIGGVWDYRDDPEGMCFAEGQIDPAKTERVKAEWYAKKGIREEELGYGIQPVPGVDD